MSQLSFNGEQDAVGGWEVVDTEWMLIEVVTVRI